MRIVDTNRYKRKNLKEDQKEFIRKIVPFAQIMQEKIRDKSDLIGISPSYGIYPSIIIALVITKTNWGKHKLVEKDNNLLLIESDDIWKGKTVRFEGKHYKSYSSWLDFSIDFSDEVTFNQKNKYIEIIKTASLDEQIKKISKLDDSQINFCDIIEEIISDYGFWEFDYG